MLVVFRHIYPNPVKMESLERLIQELNQRCGAVVMVPQIFSTHQHEQLGFKQRPLDDQLSLSNMFTCSGVDGQDLAVIVLKHMLPFIIGCLAHLMGGVADMKGDSILVDAIPGGVYLGVVEPLFNPRHILAGNGGQLYFREHVAPQKRM